MKKIWTILPAILLAFGLVFSSCGGGGGDGRVEDWGLAWSLEEWFDEVYDPELDADDNLATTIITPNSGTFTLDGDAKTLLISDREKSWDSIKFIFRGNDGYGNDSKMDLDRVKVKLVIEGELVKGPTTADSFTINGKQIKIADVNGATVDGAIMAVGADGYFELEAEIGSGVNVVQLQTSDGDNNNTAEILITKVELYLPGGEIEFVAVTEIIDVPTIGYVGVPLTLSGTVNPDEATNIDIVWSKATEQAAVGAAEFTVEGGILNATTAGTAIVTATIIDGKAEGVVFTDDFEIEILATSPLRIVVPLTASSDAIAGGVDAGTGSKATESSGTYSFNQNNFLLFEVPNDDGQVAKIQDAATIEIQFTVTSQTGQYRFGLGDPVSTGGSWNYTNLVGGSAALPTERTALTRSGNVITPKYVLIQARNGAASLTGITSINIYLDGAADEFVAVSSITGVPAEGWVNEPLTLTGTVVPSNADNRAIVWTKSAVQDAVGVATFDVTSGVLNATAAGTAKVTATIVDGTDDGVDYVQEFTITINAARFTPVTDISFSPALVTTQASFADIDLSGATIVPSYAAAVEAGETISWTVSGGGSAAISGNKITGIDAYGVITLTGTVANAIDDGDNDFVKNFTITITNVAVTNITGIQSVAVLGDTVDLSAVTVTPANATSQTIVWTVAGDDTAGSAIAGTDLTFTSAGTAKVTATITGGDWDSTLNNVKDYEQTFSINVAATAFGGWDLVDDWLDDNNAIGDPLVLSGSPTVVVSSSGIEFTNRNGDWYGIDLKLQGAGSLNVTGPVNVVVTGTTTSGTKMKVAQPAGSYTTFASDNAAGDGTFTITALNIGLSEATVRIQTESAATVDFTITNITVSPYVPGGNAASWVVDFTGLSLQSSGEYVGTTGIQRGSTSIVFAIDGNALEITLDSGTYQQITLQTGTAVGGTNYYANDGFTAAADISYTISFNAYVAEDTGSLRIGGNSLTNPNMGSSGNWDKTFTLSDTPVACEYTWTQEAAGGNLKLDTGSSATGTVFYITDLRIDWVE